MTNDAILLDTHVAIWLSLETLDQSALEIVARAMLGPGVLVSPVVAWEAGLLASSPKRSPLLDFGGDAMLWYRKLLADPQVSECALDGAIALASTMLPGEFHRDPADRFLVATARALDCALMTRDRKILAYADQGHVKAIPC